MGGNPMFSMALATMDRPYGKAFLKDRRAGFGARNSANPGSKLKQYNNGFTLRTYPVVAPPGTVART